jgi:hypothetical protein
MGCILLELAHASCLAAQGQHSSAPQPLLQVEWGEAAGALRSSLAPWAKKQ